MKYSILGLLVPYRVLSLIFGFEDSGIREYEIYGLLLIAENCFCFAVFFLYCVYKNFLYFNILPFSTGKCFKPSCPQNFCIVIFASIITIIGPSTPPPFLPPQNLCHPCTSDTIFTLKTSLDSSLSGDFQVVCQCFDSFFRIFSSVQTFSCNLNSVLSRTSKFF